MGQTSLRDLRMTFKKLKNSFGEWRGLRYVHRSLGFAPGWNGLKFRFRVKAGGHNNTQLNPVFRGMVRRLFGAG